MPKNTKQLHKANGNRNHGQVAKRKRNGSSAPGASRYLKQYNEYLRVILDHVEDLIAVVDLKGNRLYNSPSYQAVLGDSENYLDTDSFSEIHPDDRDRIKKIFKETIRTGVGRRSEYRFVRKGGTVRYIESVGSVVRDRKGSPIMLVFVSRDVTERREAEEQLKSAYRNLKTAQVKLFQSEKLALIGQLAAGVAHELKNPLGILLQGINYLENQIRMDRSSADVFGMMKDAVMRADRIVRGLLDYAQPTSLALSPGDLRKAVDAGLTAVKQQLPVKNIRVKKIEPHQLPLIMLDQHHMTQVFINILLNAFQAMPKGGDVTIRYEVKTLDEPGSGIGDGVTDYFRVGDTVLRCCIVESITIVTYFLTIGYGVSDNPLDI